jgi:26S proteasome regulatory subunit (ATPase 3-interacting protein)
MLIPAQSFWGLVADGLPPQDAEALKEDLGIEPDSDAHTAVDKSALCVPRRGR